MTINYEKIIITVKYCDLYAGTFIFNKGQNTTQSETISTHGRICEISQTCQIEEHHTTYNTTSVERGERIEECGERREGQH